jgi:hypothetical protein
MSIFSTLFTKILSFAGAKPAATTPVATDATTATAAPQPVDVTAILDGLAAKSSEDLDWKKSIVDLLKLLDIDSSFAHRKALAHELGFTGDTSDSASMNIWLHKEVLKKIAANGGNVPANLLD